MQYRKMTAPMLSPAPIKVTWTGASLTRYETHLHLIGTQFLSLPGIYIFCRPGAQDTFHAIYVGETSNFDQRIGSGIILHHCWDEIRCAGATHVCTLVTSGDTAQRVQIETDLRHGLRPPVNKQ